ncbi:MAG: MBOAT family protein [Spirochaetes bacterium]|nr:MBOAT family protein [Spirochaetota bacterium]HOD15366.1 MBOAT family O-acyltransferase [Spirochaetota bacterium]HPG50908.1 MBOAT family O-acyltransferase [Spirochaetota bacterium]
MLFSSVTFLFFFFPIALVLFYLLRNRPVGRNVLLLAASLVFYFWGEKAYTLLLLAVMAMNYGFGLWIARSDGNRSRVLALSVILNLVPLVIFKYSSFIIGNVNSLLELFGGAPFGVPQLHLPVGISFYTFAMISYVMDVYRDNGRVEKNPVSLGIFFSFFPKMLQGPIERYSNMAKDMYDRHVTSEDFIEGARRFIIGLGKKMIIANAIGGTVDRLFDTPASEFSAAVGWLAVFTFLMNLYYDFSGYTDMAIGLGRMLGFKLPENFRYPFVANSMRVFWQRWHITLMAWFRDYVYFPLGGSRVDRSRHYFNLLFVWSLTGLWHGASWGFILWGLMNGVLMVIEQLLPKNFFDRLWKPVGIAYVNLAFMLQAVFFRSPSIDYAVKLFAAMFGLNDAGSITTTMPTVMTMELGLAIALGLIGYAPVIPAVRDRIAAFVYSREGVPGTILGVAHGAAMVVIAAVILVLSYMAVASETFTPFVYGQF